MTDWKPNPLIDKYTIEICGPSNEYPSVKKRVIITFKDTYGIIYEDGTPPGARAVKAYPLLIMYYYVDHFIVQPRSEEYEFILRTVKTNE